MKRLLPDLRNAAVGYAPTRARKADVNRLGFSFHNSADEPDVTELWLYDEIGPFGIMAGDVIEALADVTTPNLRVRINSPGGSVFEGIAIMNALASRAGETTVVVDALCASVATVVAMAGKTITMSPGSQMMIHPASGVCIGASTDMRQMSDLLDFQTGNIAGLYAAKGGGSQTDWLALMNAETWMTADEAVSSGLADATGVVKQADKQVTPAAASMFDEMWDLSVFQFAGRDKAPAPNLAAHANETPKGEVRRSVRCACVPDGCATVTDLLTMQHRDACPLVTDAKKPPPIQPLTVMWDFVTHPSDSALGTCDECEGLADDGPYSIDNFPEIPVHPNCECTQEPHSATYGSDNAATSHQTPAATASPVTPIDAAQFRKTLEGAFA